jgi:hypothetical protein
VNNHKLMYRIIKSFNKWPKNDFQNKTDFLIPCLIVRLVQFLLIIVNLVILLDKCKYEICYMINHFHKMFLKNQNYFLP